MEKDNTTVVTMFYDLSSIESNPHRRSQQDYFKLSIPLISGDVNLFFVGDEASVSYVSEFRSKLSLDHKTHCVVRPITKSPYIAASNFAADPEKGWAPSKDSRMYAVVTMTKLFAIAEAIHINPFASTRFMWVDFGISHIATPDLNHCFSTLGNKVRIQIVNYAPLSLANKPEEHYSRRRSVVCGGLFGGDLTAMSRLVDLFNSEYLVFLNAGHYNTEEAIISALVAKHPTLFSVYAGDYQSIFANFVKPKICLDRIAECLKQAREYGDTEMVQHLSEYTTGSTPMRSPMIILVTMVRNESRIVGRMIASALPILSAAVIVDTGSDDQTVDVAVKACGTLPHTVVHKKWVDFSTNRNQALDAGREYVARMGWSPCDCWLLLLDADHILRPAGVEVKALAGFKDADCLMLPQESSDLRYYNARMIRASADAKYFGRTHEYLQVSRRQKSDLMSIEDRNDGGFKAHKHERDIALLMLDWNETPSGRTAFYLAQTYRFMKQYDTAMQWYERRILMAQPHESEEAWYSRLSHGRCALALEDAQTALASLSVAFTARPWRAEPLVDLVEMMFKAKEHASGCILAKMGSEIPMPTKDTLFLEKSAYSWEFAHKLSIGSHYVGRPDQGLVYCDTVMLDREVPAHIRSNALQNSTYYVPKIPCEVLDIPFTPRPGWHACNPSILACDDDWLICVRTVNYTIERGHRYKFSGNVSTKNFLLLLDKNWNVLDTTELRNPAEYPGPVEGAEDVRLYSRTSLGDEYVLDALAVSCAWDPVRKGKRCETRLRKIRWGRSGKIITSNVIHGVGSGSSEKNWLPFIDKGRSMAIYGYAPFRVIDINTKKTVVEYQTQRLDLSSFRGSAAPIAWNDGWLFVVHQTAWRTVDGHQKAFYIHRLCWMDIDYKLRRFSRPFYFDTLGIEFCAGMARRGYGAIATFGVHDSAAKMALISADVIELGLSQNSVQYQ